VTQLRREKPLQRRLVRTLYLCMTKQPEIKKIVTVTARNANMKVSGAKKENAETNPSRIWDKH